MIRFKRQEGSGGSRILFLFCRGRAKGKCRKNDRGMRIDGTNDTITGERSRDFTAGSRETSRGGSETLLERIRRDYAVRIF